MKRTLIALFIAAVVAGCGVDSTRAPLSPSAVGSGSASAQKAGGAVEVSWACLTGAENCGIGSSQNPVTGRRDGIGPTNLTFVVNGTTVLLAWVAPPGAVVSEYQIEAGSGPGLANIAVFRTGSNAPGLVVSGVPFNTYFVRVRHVENGVVADASRGGYCRRPRSVQQLGNADDARHSRGRGTAAVNVTSNCNWSAVSNATFVTITSGTSGAGNGVVTLLVAPNPGGTRSGTVTIAGTIVTVTQNAGSLHAAFEFFDPSTKATATTECRIVGNPTTCQSRSTSFTFGRNFIVSYAWTVTYTYVEAKTITQTSDNPTLSFSDVCGQTGSGADGPAQPLTVTLTVTDNEGERDRHHGQWRSAATEPETVHLPDDVRAAFGRGNWILPGRPEFSGRPGKVTIRNTMATVRYLATLLVLTGAVLSAAPQYRTLNDRFSVPEYASPAEWQQRAAYLREHILASAGLLPMPEKTPLHRAGVRRAAARRLLGLQGLLREPARLLRDRQPLPPAGAGPFPAILSPHGHWTYGRLENTALASVPGRAINLARQGFVVFTYDMIGYNDSRQLPHDLRRASASSLWGLSLAGLQLWNSIRSVDFLTSLPYVDGDRIGATGASGGGTQTFLLAAVDDRIKVAAPVNMISLHMQGGCLCENEPGLRLDTNNVELAAAIAPRPLLMVSATGDWTKETLRARVSRHAPLLCARSARETACTRCSSTRRTTTTATAARRCMRGWRAGSRTRRPMCVSRSARSVPSRCRTRWSSTAGRCPTRRSTRDR